MAQVIRALRGAKEGARVVTTEENVSGLCGRRFGLVPEKTP
jgi:hypothetical protein